MKKTVTILLAAVVLLSLVSCADKPAGGGTDKPPTNKPSVDSSGTVYLIAEYYDENGGYSALGLALDEVNTEKVLTVSAGDTLILGERKYSVVAESLMLPFYTQPSFGEVTAWWTEHLRDWEASGELVEVS